VKALVAAFHSRGNYRKGRLSQPAIVAPGSASKAGEGILKRLYRERPSSSSGNGEALSLLQPEPAIRDIDTENAD